MQSILECQCETGKREILMVCVTGPSARQTMKSDHTPGHIEVVIVYFVEVVTPP